MITNTSETVMGCTTAKILNTGMQSLSICIPDTITVIFSFKKKM